MPPPDYYSLHIVGLLKNRAWERACGDNPELDHVFDADREILRGEAQAILDRIAELLCNFASLTLSDDGMKIPTFKELCTIGKEKSCS